MLKSVPVMNTRVEVKWQRHEKLRELDGEQRIVIDLWIDGSQLVLL